MHAFSGRFSRTCLEGISFNFFVCFIFNVSLGSAPKRKNFDIQRNTRVGSGGQFTSNRSNDHLCLYLYWYYFKIQIARVENFEKDTIGGFADDDGRNQLQSH